VPRNAAGVAVHGGAHRGGKVQQRAAAFVVEAMLLLLKQCARCIRERCTPCLTDCLTSNIMGWRMRTLTSAPHCVSTIAAQVV
jgi:hypothetical protein